VTGSAALSAFHTSGRNWFNSLIGVLPIFASTLRKYACGSRLCRSALAINVHKRAWLAPAASLPANSQFFRPIATRFSARSAALLSMFRKPCSA